MRPNPGHCPRVAEGKHVRVVLADGSRPAKAWPADGRHGCRWSLTGSRFDIAQFEVIQ